jgi:hypothetical protein
MMENSEGGVIKEGLDLAQQMASLPFKAVRQAFDSSDLSERPMAEIIRESITLGEGLARLPFKAAGALLAEVEAKSTKKPQD